jgi:hypothetical protein
MSRRISSRDDLFLSALDMYTLLSLAFIGFAFFVSPSKEPAELDLPVAQGGGDPKGPERRTVQWVRGAAPNDAKAHARTVCKILVTEPINGVGRRGTTFTTACYPEAFGGPHLAPRDVRPLIAGAGPERPEVVILCRKTDGLAACASLQWLMHEAGFHTLAGVSPEP